MNDYDFKRFSSKIKKGENNDDCWIWLGTKLKNGYGQFSLNYKGYLSHRISYEYFNNCKIKIGMFILHSCDNRECCNPKHLREGTAKENTDDMILRNRNNPTLGEKNGSNKLTQNQVTEIREIYSQGDISQDKLAIEYGIARRTIRDIINRKIWKHI
jgi:hypothetical protein